MEFGVRQTEWDREWDELAPLVAESSTEALPKLDNLIERMLVARGYPVDGEETADVDEPDILNEFIEVRLLARYIETGEPVGPNAVTTAVRSYRTLYEFLRATE